MVDVKEARTEDDLMSYLRKLQTMNAYVSVVAAE
jgi:hypothetical protein